MHLFFGCPGVHVHQFAAGQRKSVALHRKTQQSSNQFIFLNTFSFLSPYFCFLFPSFSAHLYIFINKRLIEKLFRF